jgi:hypothetical protein
VSFASQSWHSLVGEFDTAKQKHFRQIAQVQFITQSPEHNEGDDIGRIKGSASRARVAAPRRGGNRGAIRRTSPAPAYRRFRNDPGVADLNMIGLYRTPLLCQVCQKEVGRRLTRRKIEDTKRERASIFFEAPLRTIIGKVKFVSAAAGVALVLNQQAGKMDE